VPPCVKTQYGQVDSKIYNMSLICEVEGARSTQLGCRHFRAVSWFAFHYVDAIFGIDDHHDSDALKVNRVQRAK
jgi:hypothetical protein